MMPAASKTTSRMFAAGRPHSTSRVPPTTPPSTPPPSAPWPCSYKALTTWPKSMPVRLTVRTPPRCRTGTSSGTGPWRTWTRWAGPAPPAPPHTAPAAPAHTSPGRTRRTARRASRPGGFTFHEDHGHQNGAQAKKQDAPALGNVRLGPAPPGAGAVFSGRSFLCRHSVFISSFALRWYRSPQSVCPRGAECLTQLFYHQPGEL